MPRPTDPDRPELGAAPIMIIDDDELARELIVLFLRKMGLRNRIVIAVDGDQALEVLTRMPEPALVLLDLELPGRSGLDVLEWLRSRGDVRLPVVALTGSTELADIDRAFELGITSYLVKPVGVAALTDVIRGLHLPWQLLTHSQDAG